MSGAERYRKLSALFPSQPFDRIGDPNCDHPREHRVMNGWLQFCGRCGMVRDLGLEVSSS